MKNVHDDKNALLKSFSSTPNEKNCFVLHLQYRPKKLQMLILKFSRILALPIVFAIYSQVTNDRVFSDKNDHFLL